MFGIPKPEYRAGSPAIAYSYQSTAPPPSPPQPWSAQNTASASTAPAPSVNTSGTASFFRFGPQPGTCAFCHAEDHQVRKCAIADEYVKSGRASIVNDRIHLPNRQPIPFDSTKRGLKASIDAWLTSQTAPDLTPAQTRAVFTRDSPPHFDSRNASAGRIEEVIESHILQVRESTTADKDEDEFSHDIFKVFATEKKKRGDKVSKAPELSVPPPPTQAPATSSGSSRPNVQYRYHSNAKDQRLLSELEDYLMQGKLSLTTPAHIFAVSPAIRKNVTEKLKV